MKKKPGTVIVAILLMLSLVVGGVLYLNSNLDAIVASIIEKQGSAATRTAVRVGGVSIKLRDATAAIDRLTVANPAGFRGDAAIEFGNFSIKVDPGSLTGDTVIIDDVTVRGARLRMLQQGTSNNLQKLLENLGVGSGTDTGDTGGRAKKVVIRRFTLEDARASVSVPDLNEDREFEVPTVVITDIGRASNGATAAEVAQQVLRPVLQRTLQSASVRLLKDKAKESLDEKKDEAINKVLERIGGHDEND